MTTEAQVVFVDVDDTLIRSAGSKQIPIPATVRRVRELFSSGAVIYCWSTGGAEYAQATAKELDLEDCFTGFLPKPTIMIDDQAPADWPNLRVVHPFAL